MIDKIISYVDPSSLKVGDNSRFRTDEDLSELMESIKQHGFVQPITARIEDKMVICGNRRLASVIKLGLDTIPVIFIPKIDDKTLLILNLLENMQRKDISSIEIGKRVDSMLKNTKFKMSLSELATSLGVSDNRIKVCLDTFKKLPPEWRTKVVHLDSSRKRKFGDLPENIVFAILNFNRSYKQLNGEELNLLLKETSNRKLTLSQIALIGLLVNSGMPLKIALKEINLYTIARLNFIVLKTELGSVQKKEGILGKQALFDHIIKKSYPNLVY